MAVIHVFKDGTTTKEISGVKIPEEIMQSIMMIAERRKEEKEMQNNGN